MQKSKNLQNTNLASVKEKIIIRPAEQRTPKTRGEIAAQEQMRILQHAIAASKGKSPEVKSMQAKVALQ
jgi:hypothetical protein